MTGLSRLAADLRLAAMFLTRLPLRLSAEPEPGALARAGWCFPLVGLAVGLLSAASFGLAVWAGLSPWLAALLALASSLLLTGALHEDGLADMADGFGGGWARDAKLEIMRDSRLGSYGAVALVMSLALRAAALAALADTLAVAVALVSAHAGARALLPAFMRATALVRSEGQSAAAGKPPMSVALIALALGAIVLGLAAWLGGAGLAFPLAAALLLALTFLAVSALARWQIGGYTGDVLGGLEQSGEIAVLLVAAALLT